MQKMNVKTGFGYIKDSQDRIVTKYILPKREHPLKDGYTFVEVLNEAALDSVIIYEPPKTIEQQRAEKIAIEIYETAKQKLIDKGEWPV